MTDEEREDMDNWVEEQGFNKRLPWGKILPISIVALLLFSLALGQSISPTVVRLPNLDALVELPSGERWQYSNRAGWVFVGNRQPEPRPPYVADGDRPQYPAPERSAEWSRDMFERAQRMLRAQGKDHSIPGCECSLCLKKPLGDEEEAKEAHFEAEEGR